MEDLSQNSDPEGATSQTEAKAGSIRWMVESFWQFFCSLRLTVVVILLLSAGCVIGMFFDQTLTLEEHRSQWSEELWKLYTFERLEFHDVFHSWWFGLVVLFLALNLIACSFERLPKIWIDIHNPQKHLSDTQLRGIRNVFRAQISEGETDLAKRFLEIVTQKKGAHYFSETHSGSGATYFFNERHRYARTGVYAIHIALLMIMFGSMYTTFNGIDGMLMVVEGTNGANVRVKGPGGLTFHHGLDFRVRCTDFRLKTYVDGAPMEFESDLEIYDPNSPMNPVITKTIQVNHPLEYKGYTFYQASYNPIPGDQSVLLDVCKRPLPPPAAGVPNEAQLRADYEASVSAYAACKKDGRNVHDVAIGDRVQMPSGIAFVPVATYGDYNGLGKAVRVQKILKDGTISSFVVFRNYPKFDEEVRRGEYIVGFRGFDQQYATGLQVGRVPLIWIVFLGFVLMFIGMYMAFFMSQRRYWGRIQPLENGKWEIILAGAARRHQYAFEEEFQKVQVRAVELFGAQKSVAQRARELREKRRAARQKDG
jgi:cytochrome c biogenesis protein